MLAFQHALDRSEGSGLKLCVEISQGESYVWLDRQGKEAQYAANSRSLTCKDSRKARLDRGSLRPT